MYNMEIYSTRPYCIENRVHTSTQEYPRIPLECPRIPQNTNNIKILIDFLFFIFFYSVDGDTLKKATLIEILFVLNYWSLILFSFIFFIIICIISIYFNVFFFYFGDFVNIDSIHVNVVHFTCWLRLVKFLLIICVWKKRITKAWLHFISPCYISCLLNTMFPLLFGFIAFFFDLLHCLRVFGRGLFHQAISSI